MTKQTHALHKLLLAVTGACCLSLSNAQAAVKNNASQYAITPVPAWVKPIANPTAGPNSDVIGGQRHLLVDRQYRDNGQQVAYHRHFVTDVVGQVGLSRASKLSVSFDPNYEKLELHSASVLRDGQKSDRLHSARIDVARTEDSSEQDLLNGEVTALVVLADVRVGDQVELRYTVIGRNPVFDPRHHSSWRTQWSVPVERSVLRITVPQSMKLSHTARPKASITKELNRGLQTVQWQWDELESSDADDNTTDWFADPDIMDVTAFTNWQEVADWGTTLFEGHSTQGADYRRLSQSMKQYADTNGLQPAMAKAIDHVQKRIRYYGVELGVNSHRPHSPDEVLKNGYGDCKDKTLLLVSLLNDMGVKASPILVSARTKRGIVKRLPNPGIFDHVVVFIEHDGKQYWVDATDSSQSGLLGLRGQPEYGAGVVLGKPGVALITRDAPMPEQPTISTHDRIYLSSFGGPADFITATTFRGRDANRIRRRLDETGTRRFGKNYKEYYEDIYGKLRMLDKLKVEEHSTENEITITNSYRLDKFWELNSRAQQAEFDAYALTITNQLDEFEDVSRDRKAPLPIDARSWVAHRIQYFPNVASNERALEESNFGIDGFSYHDSEYVIGDSFVFESELKVTTDEIDVDQLKEYNKFKNRVGRNTRSGRHHRSVDQDAVNVGKATTTLLNELAELY